MVHVRLQSIVDSALRASDAGMRDRENAQLHEVAVKTIRRWRRDYQRRGLPRGQTQTAVPCPRCESAQLDARAYAELFGWYLGDEHMTATHGGVWALHVYNDRSYPRANQRIQQLMGRVKPGGLPHVRFVPGCVITTCSWKHWVCLFPQHGPGRKHQRRIVLEPWQQEIVDDHPEEFLRGLFHSDGCRVENSVRRVVQIQEKIYHYPRWQFSNRSEDIHGLCGAALDRLGIAWKRSGSVHLSVSRREAVAALDAAIGLKG